MELFDRYVREVGRALPAKQRPDVEAELRSLLLDQLEERAAEAGRAPDEALAVAVLETMGPPARVAARYQPPRALIGPELYPTWLAVLRWVLGVVAACYGFALLVGARLPHGRFSDVFTWDGWTAVVDEILRVGVIQFGLVTLVFALIERFGWARGSSGDGAWDPRSLPRIEDRDRLSRATIAWRIYVILALAFLANVLPAAVAAITEIDGRLLRVPLLLDGIQRHLPLLDLWWAAALALNVVLFVRGRWTRATRIAEIAIGVAAVFLLVRLASGPPFLGIDPAWIATADLRPRETHALERARPVLEGMFRLGLWICVFLAACENLTRVWRLLRGDTGRPPAFSPGGAPAAAP